ncbi:MAG TPA: DUF1566 domain-containing protein [bacterium]|nr:DUF1566 domain-containing protein [bacterium]HPY15884.1 DUF1566 domain-containing protein [bacterium]
MMKYVVIILSALFVIISCTPKDRTARINEIYEELEKEVADETKDESKTPDENLEPDDEQVEEDAEIIDESDEKIDEISDEDAGDTGGGETGATCTGSDKFCHSHDGLDWSDASSYYMTWSEATTYCENLGGSLPTISELRTLIQNCPATETGGECGVTDGCLSLGGCWDACGGCEVGESGKYSVFGDTNSFWSSSELSEDADKAWVMGFGYGGVGYGGKNALVFVRCVRNGE